MEKHFDSTPEIRRALMALKDKAISVGKTHQGQPAEVVAEALNLTDEEFALIGQIGAFYGEEYMSSLMAQWLGSSRDLRLDPRMSHYS